MTKRRSVFEIRIEILENSMENIKPTHLMRASNLDYTRMLKYVDELKMGGLIEEINIGEEKFKKDRRTKINYCTTRKGINIVKIFKDVTKAIV